MSSVAGGMAMTRGFRAIRLGTSLLKKQSKTQFEERAAKSFKTSIILTLCMVGIFITVTVVSITAAFGPSGYAYSSRRTGTVVDSRVRYVQNTVKYVPLQELNINAESVKQGDKIRLYFDTQDKLVGGEAEANTDTRIRNLLITLGISFFTLILFAIIGKFTWGKSFNRWFKSVESREFRAETKPRTEL